MALFFKDIEITKLRDLAPQTGLDIADLWFGSTNVYTAWQTYEGTLPATINANGDNLRQYQVWGNAGGVGDRTANLFDYTQLVDGYTYDSNNGQMILNPDSNIRWRYSAIPFIKVTPGATYLRTWNLTPWGNYVNYYDSEKNFISHVAAGNGNPFTVPNNCHFITYVAETSSQDRKKYMLTEGSTPPASYVPFGYEVDMVIRDTTTINIGNEPLCGIGTYTDSLDLSTGILTRRIEKLVLTGEENIEIKSGNAKWYIPIANMKLPANTGVIDWYCTHYRAVANSASWTSYNYMISWSTADVGSSRGLRIRDINFLDATLASFKAHLAQQYANGTPVTVWYVLAEPKVSTITVPSGLTGTIEGYLIWDGTPTPETPIYPTANGIKQADGTYSIKYSISSTTTPIYIGDDPLDKDEYVDYQAGKIYRYETEIKKDVSQTGWQWRWETDNVTYQTAANNRVSVGRFYPEETKEYIISAVPDTFEVAVISADSSDVKTADTGWGASWTLSGASAHSFCVTARKSDNSDIAPSEVDGVKFKVTSLTSTDPPVPLPALPTCEGTTVIDYAGSGAAPEKVLLKFRKEGF